MRVEIPPEDPCLHSRPTYPNIFPLAVIRLGRSGRSRCAPTTHARFHATSLILVFKYRKGWTFCTNWLNWYATLTPSVLINSAVRLSSACIVTRELILTLGGWKIASLAHTIPLIASDGSPIRWKFPDHHSSLPYPEKLRLHGYPFTLAPLKYIAPEYALDEHERSFPRGLL